jgi:polyketide biosynthesis enoyl-CoA hydratase PksI
VSRGLFSATPLEDGVVSVCIAAEDEPYLGPDWVDGFVAVTATLAEDTSVRVIVLEGGEPYFSAGASRDTLLGANGAGPIASYAPRAARALLDVPVPTIAAAAGHATGGGLMVALLCDAIVLAEQSMYGANFMALGFTPGMGATHVIPEAFGSTLGRELLFGGRLLTGREIRQARCPLSHAVIPHAEVMKRARSMAREFAEAPRDSLVLLKQNLAGPRRRSLELALQAESAAHARLFANPMTCAEIARRYPPVGSHERIEES